MPMNIVIDISRLFRIYPDTSTNEMTGGVWIIEEEVYLKKWCLGCCNKKLVKFTQSPESFVMSGTIMVNFG